MRADRRDEARLTPECLSYGVLEATDAQVSPNGAHVLYVLTVPEPTLFGWRNELRLCGIDGRDSRLVVEAAEDPGCPRWAPHGGEFAYVARDGDSAELCVRRAGDGRRAVWARHRGPMTDVAWRSCGRRVAYTAPEGSDRLEAEPPRLPAPLVINRLDHSLDGRGFVGGSRLQTFVARPDRQPRKLTAEASDHVSPKYSPDGSCVAVIVQTGLHSRQVAVLTVDGEPICRAGPAGGYVAHIAWAPTSQSLLFTGWAEAGHKGGAFDVFIADAVSGESRLLAGGHRCSLVSDPVWLDEERILLHGVEAGASGLFLLDLRTGAGLVPVQRAGAIKSGLSVDSAGAVALQVAASSGFVGEVTSVDLRTSGETRLTHHNDALLESAPPARRHRTAFQSGDATIDAWLLFPADFDSAARHPVVIDIHGGPQDCFGEGFDWRQQCLASHGFVVAYCNPHGSDGYGTGFASSINDAWGRRDYPDIIALADLLSELPYIDSSRMGIQGFSYGGFLAAWCIAHTRRFRAAVCGCPVFDLESWLGTADVADPACYGFSRATRSDLDRLSPSTYIDRIVTPTLLLHGEEDLASPAGQSEQMFRALRQVGTPVTYVRYPGARHKIMAHSPTYKADHMARILRWFGAWLQAE